MRRILIGFLCVSMLGCGGITFTERGIVINGRKNVQPVNPVVNPITTHEFRVLILEDAANRSKLTNVQSAMMFGKETRDFLNANCVKVDGNPERRWADGSPDGLKALTGVWADMAKNHPPTSLPWLIMTNGASEIGEPLPDTWDKLKAEFDTYAGIAK